MRNPSGYGSVKKLSGNRRRPYAVTITTKYELAPKRKDISFLAQYIDAELYDQVKAQYEASCPADLVARQKQKVIGYYATRQEAMIALAEYNKNPFDIDKRNTTFKQVYEILWDTKFSKLKPSAQKAYRVSFDKCSSLYNIRMHEMKKAHMQNVVDENSDKSKSTQSSMLVLFHAIYKFCMENDICEKDYSRFVTITSTKEAREKIPFSREEIAVLWDNLDWKVQSSSDRRSMFDNIPMVDTLLVMIYTGVRVSELLDLKAGDIKLDQRYINLRGTKTKSARRIVPIHKKIIPLLEKRIDGASEEDLIFVNRHGNKFDSPAYQASFLTPMFSALNMQVHTPHECRHSFATYAASSKLNPVLVKKIIGHSAQDITQDIYTHAFIEDLIEEIDKLDI